MTITYVSTVNGTPADNADVVFGALPTGWQPGDLHLIFASVRNSGAGTVAALPGWESLHEFGNVRVLGRIAQAGDTPPTVTYAGGVAGATTLAQMVGLRGASLDLVAAAELLNASAQNIAYPALDVPMGGTAVLLLAWKQDDSGSITVPAGFTSANTTISTVGNDALQTIRYQIQTSEADIAAGTLTVTGGAAAISRTLLLAVRPAPTLTATEQDVWPPRVLLSATGLMVGDAVELYRSVAGARTLVRAGADEAITDVAFLRVDAELPFGVPVSYVLAVDGRDLATAGPVTYTLPGGKVALSDAVSGTAAQVVVLAWPERSRRRRGSTFDVGGETVLVAGPLAGFSSTLELFAETLSEVESIEDLLEVATAGTVQVRQPGGYARVDGYLGVLRMIERRFSQDGSDDRRVFVLEVVETAGWAPALEAAGYTLQDLADVYDGLTLADLADDYATLLALAQAELQP